MEPDPAMDEKGRQTADDVLGSSSPLSPSSSRKRPVPSSDSEYASEASSGQLRINTTAPVGDLCTCGLEPRMQEPKIPRPRNAFILYRQHHSPQVTAENPKLSNPDISKIIGHKWKEERSEVKETWKNLAEEEKQRHQQQYPDYRYQPRRSGRSASRSAPSPIEGTDRCQVCNGRIPASFRTPTPLPTPTSSRPDMERPGVSNFARYGMDVTRRHSIDRFPPARAPFPGQLPPVRGVDDNELLSPEMKRRRANDAGQYHPLPSSGPGPGGYEDPYGRQPGDYGRGMSEGGPYGGFARSPLPGHGPQMRTPTSAAMPPPPRPGMGGTWPEQGSSMGRRRTYDESVRLPPLQTSIPQFPPRTALDDSRYQQTPSTGSSSMSYAQASPPESFDAQIKTVPFSRKLGVLARVCQPVPVASGPDRREIEARGAFIAVESSDAEMLASVGRVVEKGLGLSDNIALKIWMDDTKSSDSPIGSDAASSSGHRSSPPLRESSTLDFFQSMMRWQEKSAQIETYISRASEVSQRIEGQGGSEEGRPKVEENLRGPVHVALARDGYSLTLSDRYAYSTRFKDTYGPMDHWQWMASMWRGTVCPDLIIYAQPASEEELSRMKTVEFVKSMGMIVVRGSWRDSVDEATERRLLFELNEWVREGSFREEKPSNWRRE